MQTIPSYSLEATKFDAAVDILERELSFSKSILLSNQKLNRQIFILISVLVCALVPILILANHEVITITTTIVCVGIFFVVFFGFLIVQQFRTQLLPLRRFRRIKRSLGVKPETMTIRFQDWKVFRRQLAGLLPGLLPGLLISIAGFIISLGALFVSVYLSYIKGFGRWIVDLGIISLIVLNYLITRKGLILIISKLMEWTNQQIAEDARLHMRLVALKKSFAEAGKGERISIPEKDYKRIARIERAIISLEQEQAVKKKDPLLRPIQLSPVALKKISALEASARLKVQSQIDQLSSDLQPPDAYEETQGLWRLSVPESSWEISYSLIGDPQLVKIHDIRKLVNSKITQHE